jgi:SsrA-binding protein
MATKSSAKKTENKKNDKSDKKGQEPFFKTVAENRRARHDYEILEKHEAGVSLFGTEVKSIRLGKASLQEAYVKIEAGEVWLYNCNIAHYEWGNRNNHEPARKRRLLMHDREILRLKAQVQEKGLTLIPLRLYFKGNLIKCEVALGKGRKLYDKRETIAQKDTKRQLDRLMKQSGR